MPPIGLPRGLDLQQLGRQVPDGLGDLLLLLLPAFGADLAERRPLGAGADVLLHQGDILDRDLDLDVVGVLDREILALPPFSSMVSMPRNLPMP